MTIHFHIPGQPVGKGRPRIGKVGAHFDNKPHGYVVGTHSGRTRALPLNPRPSKAFGGTNGSIPGMGPEYLTIQPGTSAQKAKQGKPPGHYKKKVAA